MDLWARPGNPPPEQSTEISDFAETEESKSIREKIQSHIDLVVK